MAAAAWTRTCFAGSGTLSWLAVLAVLLLLARAADGVLPGGPAWRHQDHNDLLRDVVRDGVVDVLPGGGCRGAWACLRADLADGLGRILASEQYNVTPALAVERIVPAVPGGPADRMDASLNEAGLPTLAATAIKVFESHALVWKMWPGMLHLKIFRSPSEGMDAAVEVPPSSDGRTWGLGAIGARRRLTMALLPIMYKMGVGTTLLGVLVFLALKTMFMVSILFVLAISSFAKHKLGGFGGGQPAYVHYAPPPHHKEVHVHVHADKQAYGGWHRYGGHHGHHHDAGYHTVYPAHHSGPPVSEEGYYESEGPTYYHRRTGLGGYAGSQQLLQQGQYGQYLPSSSQRWDAPSAGGAEPAYYTGSYSR